MIAVVCDNQETFIDLLHDWAGWLFILALIAVMSISDIGGKK